MMAIYTCSSPIAAIICAIDAVDRAILRELQSDGRLANNALAERVHMSPSSCLRRVRRLEDAGIISGYRAIVDRREIGLALTVFSELVAAHSEGQAAELERRVAEIDEIVSCHMLAGSADFLLEIAVPDLAAYERLLLDKLLQLPGVTDIRSAIVIRTTKEHGPLPVPAT